MLASAVANGRCVAHAPVARVAKTHRSRVAHPLRAVGTGESSATSSGEASEGPAPPALDSEVRRSRRARRAREATRATTRWCFARPRAVVKSRDARKRAREARRSRARERDPIHSRETDEDETLRRQMGVDYAPFKALLEAGEWEKADDEHRRLMCVLAGEDAEDREWVYFTEVDNMPATDLRTIDELWKFYSNNRFGFSVQRKIWISQKKQWAKFFKKIDWTTGENGDYRKFPQEFQWRADAAPGHMPLTNALRGTQLLAALLEHPAFGPGLPPRTSEGSFFEGTASKETPVRLELPTVGGTIDVVGRFGKFVVLFGQELLK